MLFRNLTLRAAENPTLVRFIVWASKHSGLARRFVPSETMEDALATVRRLNQRGLLATLNLLGERATSRGQASRAAETYRDLLEAIHKSGVQSSISVKLTQLGLDMGKAVCATQCFPTRLPGQPGHVTPEGAEVGEIVIVRESFADLLVGKNGTNQK